MSTNTDQDLAAAIFGVAQTLQPSISVSGNKVVIVYQGQRYEMPRFRSTAIQENMTRFR